MRASEFVESYFDAWNHHDSRAIADHLSAEGIYFDVPEHSQRSADDLVIYLDDYFANYRHRYELIGDILTNENSIAFQYRIFGLENDREHEMPISYQGVEFITFNGDAAMTITDYYDIPIKSQPNKYAKSGLTRHQLLTHKQDLDSIMQSRQEYLRSGLTLPKLAQAVGCSVNILSQVINSGFGTSFFDYLNRYRIEHARKLLEDSDSQNDAILTIAFTVGFNSNSAFYSAFKKHVGMTPAQYRQRYLQIRH
jgi:AraC-like DNA-binding protein